MEKPTSIHLGFKLFILWTRIKLLRIRVNTTANELGRARTKKLFPVFSNAGMLTRKVLPESTLKVGNEHHWGKINVLFFFIEFGG